MTIADGTSTPAEQTAPVTVTFITWDANTDGVAVLHDGVEVWRERSFDSLDQYLRDHAPVGVPIVIDHAVRD